MIRKTGQYGQFLVSSRIRQQSTSVSHHNPSVSLDLDFVLGLLDSSTAKKSINSGSVVGEASTSWSRMKFKVIETGEVNESKENNSKKCKMSFYFIVLELNFDDFSSFFAPLTTTPHSNTSSTLDRLQSLADSLPNQIYDRNGNLMPLNSQTPPMSFFEIGNVTTKSNTNLVEIVRTVPIFEREGVDWSKISLTSILKKIVPEEAFLHTKINNEEQEIVNEETTVITNVSETAQVTNNVKFTMTELKLLDKDQLYSLAKHFNIRITNQTDHKLEQEIFLACNGEVYKRTSKSLVSKEKIAWTEENENLLVKLYEELRIEKQKADTKAQTLLSGTTSGYTNAFKKCKGSSERGLWAVLTDQMRHASKYHVSMSECRNKLIILKRLKA